MKHTIPCFWINSWWPVVYSRLIWLLDIAFNHLPLFAVISLNTVSLSVKSAYPFCFRNYMFAFTSLKNKTKTLCVCACASDNISVYKCTSVNDSHHHKWSCVLKANRWSGKRVKKEERGDRMLRKVLQKAWRKRGEGERRGQKQGGGIANDFTSSCGTWLEWEKRKEGKEGRNSGRGNKMGFEILLMERK